MGRGAIDVYVFVDPLCPHSRDFVEMIAQSEKMQSKYHYYFYLYTLKRFHSEDVVATIFASQEPLMTLKEVMVQRKDVALQQSISKETQKKVDAISSVAMKLDVYKRPYMIMVKKPKQKRGTH